MSRSIALGSVSKSLRNLLLEEMTITPKVPITLLGPDEPGDARRVNLFLHRVEEHPQLRNNDFRLKRGTPDTLIAPPLPLVLTYLMTAYAVTDADTGNADAQSILGEAMRVFYQHPVVPDIHLEDDLSESGEELRAIRLPLDAEEVSRIWTTFDEPFRLSVQYEVSVVQLDQSPAAERPIPQRVRTIGVPDVRAPFDPPRLVGIHPISGPTGTAVTVTGENLTGWRATVGMTGVEVVAGMPLTGDTFVFAVPAGLDPGFHRIRIDVSRMARTTLFFEVV